MGEVVEGGFITKLDIPVGKILSKAGDKGLKTALVIGWTAEGELYFASSIADGAEVLWLLELTKKNLLEIGSQ